MMTPVIKIRDAKVQAQSCCDVFGGGGCRCKD